MGEKKHLVMEIFSFFPQNFKCHTLCNKTDLPPLPQAICVLQGGINFISVFPVIA